MKKKSRKVKRTDSSNPRIRTLDQALKLSKTETGKAIVALLDRVECRFTGPSTINQLTRGERLLWDVTYMGGEVINGGFHQYLSNSTGETGEDIKLYLKELGATQTLRLFRQLSKIFPQGKIPRNQEKRCNLLEQWQGAKGNKLIEKLGDAFYLQKESLDSLLLVYVEKHRADFAEPSDEVVKRLKLKNRITKHFCGSAEPEWVAMADKTLDILEEAFESPAAKQAQLDWETKTKAELKAFAMAGKKAEVIRIYSGLFMCSMAKAKAAVEQMLKSKKG